MTESTVLKLLYGEDYAKILSSECVSFSKENENTARRQALRLFAAFLIFINIAMSVMYFPLCKLYQMFTNYTMIVSFISILLCIYCASKPNIHQLSGRLACLHIIFECAFIFNVVTLIVYWGAIHKKGIVGKEGAVLLHQYLVHSFPAISLWITSTTFNCYLSVGHWKLFAPVAIIYAVVNYLETKKRGKPLYWFLTWEDYTSVLIYAGLMFTFILVWITMAKLSHRGRKTEDNKSD